LSAIKEGEIQVKVWSKVLSIAGVVLVVASLFAGNLPGLFGVGLLAIVGALVLWALSRNSKRN